MRDWLTIEVVTAALLVTSITCVGLLALWAATSPRHWFLRLLVVVSSLSPLLAIPACEPFLVFMLQTSVVVLGVRTWKFTRKNKPAIVDSPSANETASEIGRLKLRFSLPTLFWLMAAVTIQMRGQLSQSQPDCRPFRRRRSTRRRFPARRSSRRRGRFHKRVNCSPTANSLVC